MDYPEFCRTPADKVAYDKARLAGWAEWVRLPADLRAIEKGCYFSIKKALKVRRFFETLLYIAPGRPFILLDWQWKDVIGPLFGWRAPDGKRRFREAYIEIPKGAGKSLLCSGIALYMLIGDGRYGAEVHCAASDKIQAETVYAASAKMVDNSPTLRRRLQVNPSTKRILLKSKRTRNPIAIMRPLSKVSGSSEGLKSHCMIVDECHILKDRNFFGSLRYATTKRDNPDHDNGLLLIITTAGNDRKSIGWDEHEKARKYLDGIVEYEDYHAVIYAADEDDDPFSEATWRKANPSIGITTDLSEVRQAALKAQHSKSELYRFKRYRLNLWVLGQVDGWLPMDKWLAATPPRSLKELLKKACWAGLDLSSTEDITALVLVFPDGEGNYDLHPYFWCPEETVIARTQSQNVPYQKWVDEGYIETTPGSAVDYHFIVQRIQEIRGEFTVKSVALDKGWQGQGVCNDLMDAGCNVVPFGMGFDSMSIPSKAFEGLVRSGKLRHNNPVLTWMASNATVVTNSYDQIRPCKRKSTEKIDGIIGSIIAVARAAEDGAAQGSYKIEWI